MILFTYILIFIFLSSKKIFLFFVLFKIIFFFEFVKIQIKIHETKIIHFFIQSVLHFYFQKKSRKNVLPSSLHCSFLCPNCDNNWSSHRCCFCVPTCSFLCHSERRNCDINNCRYSFWK